MLFATALIVLPLLLPLPPKAAKDECFNTCLDYCQTRGADVSDSCACNFGTGEQCACLCSDDEGSQSCDSFPGCTSSGVASSVLGRLVARHPLMSRVRK